MSSSLHPPTVVHVATASPGISPSQSNLEAIEATTTTSYHDPGGDGNWTDSPLSSAPNSPFASPHRSLEDDDDDDHHQLAALDHLRVPESLMMCTGYALQKQDSKLGRESRLSRLRLENQARFMQLEEKKSGDDSDHHHHHHPHDVYNYNNEVSEHSTGSMLRDVSERTTQEGSEGIEVVPRRRRASYTAVGAAQQQVDRRPSISGSSAFFMEDPGDIPLDEVDEQVPPPPPPPPAPQQQEEEDVPLDEIPSSLVLLHEQEDSPMDEVDGRVVPTTTATTTYESRHHVLSVHKIHEDDVPLDEVDDLAPAPLSPSAPPQPSNGDKNPSSAPLVNTSIDSIPLDEVDELLTPPRQPRRFEEEEEAETQRRLVSEDNSSNNEDSWRMTNPEMRRSAAPTDELVVVRTPPRQQPRSLPPPPQRQPQQASQDGMVTFDASTNVFEQNRLSSSSWVEQKQQQNVPPFDEMDDARMVASKSWYEESSAGQSFDLHAAPTDEKMLAKSAASGEFLDWHAAPMDEQVVAKTWSWSPAGERSIQKDNNNSNHSPSRLAAQAHSPSRWSGDRSDVPMDESIEVVHNSPTAVAMKDMPMRDVSPSSRRILRDLEKTSRSPQSSGKKYSAKKDATHVIDLTQTTISQEHDLSGDQVFDFRQHVGNDDDDEDAGSDVVCPLPDIDQQRQPLFPHDDMSSSDETPIVSNSPSGRVQSARSRQNNKVDWSKINQERSRKHPQRQRRQKRLRRKGSKKLKEENTSLELPALVVDQEQLRAIGVKAMMSVCNGIGSLFLASSETNQNPTRRRSAVESYKMLHDKPSPRRKSPKGQPERVAPAESLSSKRQKSRPPNHNPMQVSAAVFPEALQRSVEAESGIVRARREVIETRVRVQSASPNGSPSPSPRRVKSQLVEEKQENELQVFAPTTPLPKHPSVTKLDYSSECPVESKVGKRRSISATQVDSDDWSLAREIEKRSPPTSTRQSVAEHISSVRPAVEPNGKVPSRISFSLQSDAHRTPSSENAVKWMRAVNEIAIKSRAERVSFPSPRYSETSSPSTKVATPPSAESRRFSINSGEQLAQQRTAISEPPSLEVKSNIDDPSDGVPLFDQPPNAKSSESAPTDCGPPTLSRPPTIESGSLDNEPPSLRRTARELPPDDDNEPPSLIRLAIENLSFDMEPPSLSRPTGDDVSNDIEPPAVSRPTFIDVSGDTEPPSLGRSSYTEPPSLGASKLVETPKASPVDMEPPSLGRPSSTKRSSYTAPPSQGPSPLVEPLKASPVSPQSLFLDRTMSAESSNYTEPPSLGPSYLVEPPTLSRVNTESPSLGRTTSAESPNHTGPPSLGPSILEGTLEEAPSAASPLLVLPTPADEKSTREAVDVEDFDTQLGSNCSDEFDDPPPERSSSPVDDEPVVSTGTEEPGADEAKTPEGIPVPASPLLVLPNPAADKPTSAAMDVEDFDTQSGSNCSYEFDDPPPENSYLPGDDEPVVSTGTEEPGGEEAIAGQLGLRDDDPPPERSSSPVDEEVVVSTGTEEPGVEEEIAGQLGLRENDVRLGTSSERSPLPVSAAEMEDEDDSASQASSSGSVHLDDFGDGSLTPPQKPSSEMFSQPTLSVFDVEVIAGPLVRDSSEEGKKNDRSDADSPTTPPHKSPSKKLSPMSSFLASRMEDTNKPVLSISEDHNVTVEEDRQSSASCSDGESDCSSTGRLLSQLDDMVKDLGGLADSRRIERTSTADYFAAELLSFDIVAVPETSSSSKLKGLVSKESPDYVADAIPALVKSLNNDTGIPKGDIMVSLLSHDNAEPGSWANRVDEAIWRGRSMRRQFSTQWQEEKATRKRKDKPRRRMSICIDVDEVRAVGGIDKLADTQDAAFDYLKYDDFDDALTLCESVNFSCETFVDEMPPQQADKCKPCIATTLYNIGVVHMLRGEHDDALPCFEQAADLRSEFLGIGHVDHIASLVKTAMCRFALEDYAEAYVDLKDALSLSRENTTSLTDYRQLAEILNNLGCLSYMGAELEKAMLFFREAVKIQTIASENSLYMGSKFSSQAISLNASITNGNIGFLSLVLQDVPESVTTFESAVREQQLLLRDAHATLVRTMEHLVVANLFAGRKRHALQLLRRLYHIQLDAYGKHDSRCITTWDKITMLEEEESPVQETVPVDQTIQEIPVFDESQEGGKLNKNIFKALKRRWGKKKRKNGSPSKTLPCATFVL